MSLKEKLINKSIYLCSLIGMCLILFSVSYFFFLKTYDIDVTGNIDIIYTGESGAATARVLSNPENINQRTEAFMNSLTFDVEPNVNLTNGETITIKAHYDEELASTYHFRPVDTVRQVVVEGLPNRYAQKTDIPQAYIGKLSDASSKWLIDNRKTVFTALFNRKPDSSLQLEVDPVYSAFLKSKSPENTDKFICVYACDFIMDHTSYQAYYIVCVPGLNDSQKLDKNTVYGEKAYLEDKESIENYIGRIYAGKYDIEMVYQSADQFSINEAFEQANTAAEVEKPAPETNE